MASGPRRSHTTFAASHDSRASRCDPAQRSEVLRAAAMKLWTGPMESASNAASSSGSSAKAPANAETRSRWSQMEWSGMRVSAGSSGQSWPSAPLSSSSRSSGPKRQKASSVRRQSTSPSFLTSRSKWARLRSLMSWMSVSAREPRSNSLPLSGWIRMGCLVQRTCAHSAIARVLVCPFPVVTVTSSIGHCGRSAADAHQSARWTVRYMPAGMPFLDRTVSRASSPSGGRCPDSGMRSKPSSRCSARDVPPSWPAGSRNSTSAFSAGSCRRACSLVCQSVSSAMIVTPGCARG